MTKAVKNDAVDEASLKVVSKYLDGRKLNIVNIPLFEKLFSMKDYYGPNRESTTGKVESGKKSTEAALTNKSSKLQSQKSVHVEKKYETGFVNPAFQSSDTVEDSGKSEAGEGFAIDSEVVAESKKIELKPVAPVIDRSSNESGRERRENGDAKSEHQKDCVMQEVNNEDDGNPGVEPRVENKINNNAGQDKENEMVGQAMKSAMHQSVEGAVANILGEVASSDESDAGVGDDESNDEEQRVGPRKVSLRKIWLQNKKNAPKRAGDRMRRKHSRRSIGGGRLRSARTSRARQHLDEEAVIERFHEADNAQVEGQAAVEGGGIRGNELQGEHPRGQLNVAQQDLRRDANERREGSDNTASDDFLTEGDWQTTDGFQTADDEASESDSVGTHGDDFYDCEDAISLDENAEPTTRQGLMPTHRDLGAGGDDYDGDDSNGSIVDGCTRTTDSMHVEDTVLEQTVVETAPNTVRILHDMEVDQIPPVAVGGEGVPGTAIGHAEASNNRGESSRSAVKRLEPSPDNIANVLAFSNRMPRTLGPVACAVKAESSTNRDLLERVSSQGPNYTRAGNNKQAFGCDAPVVRQMYVGNCPPRATNNVLLHEWQNFVQVWKNSSVSTLQAPGIPAGNNALRFRPSDACIPCEICGRRFRSVADVHSHVAAVHLKNSEDRERRFQCEFCPFRAYSKASIRQHTLLHTGEMPYKCDLCTYGARQKFHLDRHRQKAHGMAPTAKRARYPRRLPSELSILPVGPSTSSPDSESGGHNGHSSDPETPVFPPVFRSMPDPMRLDPTALNLAFNLFKLISSSNGGSSSPGGNGSSASTDHSSQNHDL